MFGTIDCTADGKLQSMLNANPIDTLIMVSVPGSADDVANIAMAKTLSGQSIATQVPEDGLVASGGVDLFLAGATRTIGPNATVGVHSWAEADGTQGIDVYNENPASELHQLYIVYYDQFITGLKMVDPLTPSRILLPTFTFIRLRQHPRQGCTA